MTPSYAAAADYAAAAAAAAVAVAAAVAALAVAAAGDDRCSRCCWIGVVWRRFPGAAGWVGHHKRPWFRERTS